MLTVQSVYILSFIPSLPRCCWFLFLLVGPWNKPEYSYHRSKAPAQTEAEMDSYNKYPQHLPLINISVHYILNLLFNFLIPP